MKKIILKLLTADKLIMINNNMLAYFILGLIISCTGTRKLGDKVAGSYIRSENTEDNTKLNLFEDNTFYMELNGKNISTYLEGTWKEIDKSLILQYNKEPKSPEMWKVIEKNYSGDSIKIVMTTEKEIMPVTGVTLAGGNRKSIALLNSEGNYMSIKIPLDTIIVDRFRLERFMYRVKDRQSNLFIIDLGRKMLYAKNYLRGCPDKCIDTLKIMGSNIYWQADTMNAFKKTSSD